MHNKSVRFLSTALSLSLFSLAETDGCSLAHSVMRESSFCFLSLAGFERSLMDVGGLVTRGCYLFVV